ncbi:MAG: hypothetical protein H7070_08760, partial [Saprospiraceae bacterium]|nr:hypothetical protein [Pyrinomonadaceae bacterium]
VQNGKTFSVDPNRIFTENGRNCGTSLEISAAVKAFAGQLLAMILAPDGRTLRGGERFLVAVHNNTDVSGKAAHAKAGDLTASAFVKLSGASHGSFHDQADGAYLSNLEDDPDNFIFVSTISSVGFFAEKGFNVVVQKPAAELHSTRCSVDDGSLSVFSAQNAIPYICLEADAVNGAFRQRKMFESIYTLLKNQL